MSGDFGKIPMPSASERKKNLFKYVKEIGIVSPNIDQEIERIVSETKNYSISEYNLIGEKEEQGKIREVFGID